MQNLRYLPRTSGLGVCWTQFHEAAECFRCCGFGLQKLTWKMTCLEKSPAQWLSSAPTRKKSLKHHFKKTVEETRDPRPPALHHFGQAFARRRIAPFSERRPSQQAVLESKGISLLRLISLACRALEPRVGGTERKNAPLPK